MTKPNDVHQQRMNAPASGGGTLKTLSLVKINGKQRWTEVVVNLSKLLYVIEYPGDDYPNTCFLAQSDEHALHVDLSLKQMRKILDEHNRLPFKNFDTHGE
jgi:hypothetical protein